MKMKLLLTLKLAFLSSPVLSFTSPSSSYTGCIRTHGLQLSRHTNDEERDNEECCRRTYLKKALVGAASATLMMPLPRAQAIVPAAPSAKKDKSRIEGYAVQHTTAEWTTLLSGAQYNVLRRGGTERQRGSILENEKRPGNFSCAGCKTPLFVSSAKFQSGTGWPSFESAIEGAVEVEEMSWIQASMDGAEVRCITCGGHLGDVFNDGGRFGSKTGKRYCINGAALVFRPTSGENEVRGDLPPPNKVIQYEPTLRRDPVV